MQETNAPLHVVIGAGPTGLALLARLGADGRRVRLVTRSGRADVAKGVEVVAADMTDAESAKRGCSGAAVVFGCLGLPNYQGWPEKWPPMMAGMLTGAETAGARFVFLDNLYMYGPVDGTIHEGLPLTSYGKKPAVRARITRQWQDAHESGRLLAAAVRASDFYGPGVHNAMLGDYVAKPVIEGKVANLLGDPEQPHSFTYVPDIARALVDVGDAAEDVYGQAWHVPNAPAISIRQIVEMIAREAGQSPKTRVAPQWMVSVLGLFDPNMREMKEMLYQWSRPYEVDHAKFETRFWGDYTPLDEGIRETVRWYRSLSD